KTASEQIQAAAAGQTVKGAIKAVSPDVLKGLLPASVASGYARTDLSSQSGSVGGGSSSEGSGGYAKGDSQITLKVTDLATAGAFTGMVGAMDIQSSKQTGSRYEKVGKVDGRLTTEEYDGQAKNGRYSVVVADRFVVEANGSGVGMDDL